ncbi:hypothetical protein [Glycomyces sp. NRRL B-16210]|uniref:hypothetical protein n=1 Tax=Glycomyces sp. NRRL B-16210 TaxID=1463821 RepID=UPI0004C2266F|nr:hypothetical protein [Glycomyces sp. NRRL B-16210]
MLPQPNFGPNREPVGPDEDDSDAPPRKLRRLQIAMWIQVVCAVLAGNVYAFNAVSARSVSREDILEYYTEYPPVEGDPAEVAQAAYTTFQSTSFLVTSLVIAGLAVVAAIIAAMCAIRFKSRLKAVRWWAVGATAVLFVEGMYMSVQFGLLVAPWVFASVLALWWLFSSEIRYWMNESFQKAAPKEY